MVNKKLQFTLQAQSWQARAGIINLNGVEVKTPIFMPVGTKATIKWIVLDMIRNPDYLWELEPINLMLANTFHLHLRPGETLVQQAGGVQKFSHRFWDQYHPFPAQMFWLPRVAGPSLHHWGRYPWILPKVLLKDKSPVIQICFFVLYNIAANLFPEGFWISKSI